MATRWTRDFYVGPDDPRWFRAPNRTNHTFEANRATAERKRPARYIQHRPVEMDYSLKIEVGALQRSASSSMSEGTAKSDSWHKSMSVSWCRLWYLSLV